jgi:hypothetical protein
LGDFPLFESDNYQFLDSLLQPVSKALQIALKNCLAKVFLAEHHQSVTMLPRVTTASAVTGLEKWKWKTSKAKDTSV